MAQVQGHCDPEFSQVRDLFQKNLDSGAEIGASFAVNINGVDVINIWGGYTSPSATSPWEEDTIVTVFSSGKPITALAIMILVNDGLLSVTDKVSKYWPEFAGNGKEGIEVRHLLAHTSGLASWDDEMSMEGICDLQISTAKLAAQAPQWSPGTASGYHSFTFGHLLGEIVRRITGLSLTSFIAQRISAPRGADFQLGCKESDWGRISNVIPAGPRTLPEGVMALQEGSVMKKVLTNPVPSAEFTATETWRKAEIGAGNGFTNAKGLVDVLSAVTLAGTTYDTHPLLRKETRDVILEEQVRGTDLGIGIPVRFCLGFGLRGDEGFETFVDGWLPEGRVGFWGGWGGSMAICDVGRGVTIGYAMNKMCVDGEPNWRLEGYVKAVYEALGVSVGGVK